MKSIIIPNLALWTTKVKCIWQNLALWVTRGFMVLFLSVVINKNVLMFFRFNNLKNKIKNTINTGSSPMVVILTIYIYIYGAHAKYLVFHFILQMERF